jgi:hypothetical protein
VESETENIVKRLNDSELRPDSNVEIRLNPNVVIRSNDSKQNFERPFIHEKY